MVPDAVGCNCKTGVWLHFARLGCACFGNNQSIVSPDCTAEGSNFPLELYMSNSPQVQAAGDSAHAQLHIDAVCADQDTCVQHAHVYTYAHAHMHMPTGLQPLEHDANVAGNPGATLCNCPLAPMRP
jgi:hypothetical protein